MNIRSLYSIVSIIIIYSNTTDGFTWKKIYTTIVPQKIHKEIVYEEYKFDHGTLILNNIRGDIQVKTGWDSDKIFLKAIKKTPQLQELPELTFVKKSSENSLTIESKFDENNFEGGIDFELIVPHTIALKITAREGNIQVNKVNNPIILATEFGNIEVIQAQNTVKATAHKKGSISIHQPQKAITAFTNNGTISIYDAQSSIQAHSENGDIEIHSKMVPSTSLIKVATTSGTIKLYLPKDINAQLSAETKYGTVTSEQTITISSFATSLNNSAWKRFKREVEGILGSGEAQIKLSSVNSNIHLIKEKA
jgi:hypothetical protein